MGRHIEMLAKHWSMMPVPFDRIVLVAPKTAELPELGTKNRIELIAVTTDLPNLAWEQVVMPQAAQFASVLFCPAYTCPVAYGGRIVLANHGIYEALPQEFPLL